MVRQQHRQKCHQCGVARHNADVICQFTVVSLVHKFLIVWWFVNNIVIKVTNVYTLKIVAPLTQCRTTQLWRYLSFWVGWMGNIGMVVSAGKLDCAVLTMLWIFLLIWNCPCPESRWCTAREFTSWWPVTGIICKSTKLFSNRMLVSMKLIELFVKFGKGHTHLWCTIRDHVLGMFFMVDGSNGYFPKICKMFLKECNWTK